MDGATVYQFVKVSEDSIFMSDLNVKVRNGDNTGIYRPVERQISTSINYNGSFLETAMKGILLTMI